MSFLSKIRLRLHEVPKRRHLNQQVPYKYPDESLPTRTFLTDADPRLRYYLAAFQLAMDVEPDGAERIRRKLDFAIRQICRNISAFSPEELEEMVKEKLIDPRAVPPDLRTPNVRYRLGLTK